MTIKDLSARTGYSVGTISRVLNDHPNVSKKARERILQEVEDSGFQLNANAKQLKQQQSNSILVLCKGNSNELYDALLFAMSDVMAMGAIRALCDAGKRIPRDVSVMGFDSLYMGGFTVPRLSTVAQSVDRLAEEGLNLLLSSIEKGVEAAHKIIPVELLLRKSVRKV